MKILKIIILVISGFITLSCSSIPQRQPFQVAEWLRTTEPKMVEFITGKLLLFEMDDPIRWQEAKNALRQVPLWPPIDYLVKETENTNHRRAFTARWKLSSYGKMIKYLKAFDGDSLAEWNTARQELTQLGSEAIENMVAILSQKFLLRERKYRQWAAEQLKTIGTAGILPISLIIKKTPDQEIIEPLASILVNLGADSEPPVKEIIMGDNLNRSLTLIKILGETRPYYSRELLEYISKNHKHPVVKAKATEILARLPKE